MLFHECLKGECYMKKEKSCHIFDFSKKTNSYILGIFLSLFLIGIDQLTKYLAVFYLKGKNAFPIIKEVFELAYVENRGAAFGMMQGKLAFFIPLTILMCSLFIFIYVKLPYERKFNLLRVIICFIFAGAIGNFIDRTVHGYVIDFLSFILIHFPVFNVADIYITCSAFLFAFLLLFYYKDEDLERIHLFKKG